MFGAPQAPPPRCLRRPKKSVTAKKVSRGGGKIFGGVPPVVSANGGQAAHLVAGAPAAHWHPGDTCWI